MHYLRHVPHTRHGAGHPGQAHEKNAEAKDNMTDFNNVLPFAEHDSQDPCQKEYRGYLRKVKGNKLGGHRSTDIGTKDYTRRLIQIHQPRVDEADHHYRTRRGLYNRCKNNTDQHSNKAVLGKHLQDAPQLGPRRLLNTLAHQPHAKQEQSKAPGH